MPAVRESVTGPRFRQDDLDILNGPRAVGMDAEPLCEDTSGIVLSLRPVRGRRVLDVAHRATQSGARCPAPPKAGGWAEIWLVRGLTGAPPGKATSGSWRDRPAGFPNPGKGDPPQQPATW